MDVIPFFKAFPVYNIDQTNLAEVQPERVQKLMEKFKVPSFGIRKACMSMLLSTG